MYTILPLWYWLVSINPQLKTVDLKQTIYLGSCLIVDDEKLMFQDGMKGLRETHEMGGFETADTRAAVISPLVVTVI